MSIAAQDDLYLDQAAAEGYGGYSILRRDITAGTLPARKDGRRWVVCRSDLEARSQRSNVDAVIERLVDAAPPLTDEQIAKLRVLLGGEHA